MNHNMKLHIAVKSELQIILKPKKNFFFLNFIFEIIFWIFFEFFFYTISVLLKFLNMTNETRCILFCETIFLCAKYLLIYTPVIVISKCLA